MVAVERLDEAAFDGALDVDPAAVEGDVRVVVLDLVEVEDALLFVDHCPAWLPTG